LHADSDGNVYVADTGNRRLLKVNNDGKAQVIFRSEPPYFPTGVAAADADLYVLEVGLTLPNAWSAPRIQKIDAAGKSTILATVGAAGNSADLRSSFATRAGVSVESVLAFLYNGGRVKYTLSLIAIGLLSLIALIWHRRRRLSA